MASGDMLGWNAMIHKSGAKRAKGGSGALTQALAKCLLESHGGEIICNAEVVAIVPRETPDTAMAAPLQNQHEASCVMVAI